MRRPDHNNVDFSQRTAAPRPDGEQRPAWADMMPKWWFDEDPRLRHLRAAFPYWSIWNDPEKKQEFLDAMAEDEPGRDTTPEEDARVRSESPRRRPFEGDDEYLQNPAKWNQERKKL